MRRPKGFDLSAHLGLGRLYPGAGQAFASAAGAPAPASRLREVADFGPNPGGLKMLLHIPADLPARSPLVVVLHGCGQSAAAYDRGAGWSALADRLGFAVLAPEQSASNNPNGCFNWFQPGDTTRDHGEAASIRQMVASAIADHRLDPRRVFVTGLSAGGAMTSAMLAAYPEVFAGGAMIAGVPYGAAGNVQEALGAMRQAPARSPRAWGDLVRKASPHRGPWPRISVWHGGADFIVSNANAQAIIDQWTDVHGLPPAAALTDVVDGYPRRVWRDSQGRPVLESYTITGMAHGVPIHAGAGADEGGVPGPFILEAGISSSYRIAQFWGLAEPVLATARPSVAEPRRDPPPQPAIAARTLGGFDPGAVIANALRAAGLMKSI